MIFKDEFIIQLQITGETLKVCKCKNNKIINFFTFNLLDDDFHKGFFQALMNHWGEYKLVCNYKDLQFLRKIGIRI